jgi:hypothetical protein
MSASGHSTPPELMSHDTLPKTHQLGHSASLTASYTLGLAGRSAERWRQSSIEMAGVGRLSMAAAL